MRRHKDPSRRQSKPGRQPKQTTQAQKTPTSPATTTTARSTGALHPIRGAAPVTWRCTRYVAVHPLRGAAPVTWRCTRTEEVHCLRIGCSAPRHKNKRGTGTPNHSPPHPSMRSWALLVAGWARRPRRPRRPRRHLHSSPLQPTPAHSNTSHTLTCEEPVFASVRWIAGLAETWKGRRMPKWPRWRKR